MIRKLRKMLFGLSAKEHLDIAPRMYSNEYDRHVSSDVAKVFARSSARSPENVKALMKSYQVNTIDELLDVLPSRQRRVNTRQRIRFWMAHNFGLLNYDPLRPMLHRLTEQRNIPNDAELIYRTKYPYDRSE